jgi:hypothetical protein
VAVHAMQGTRPELAYAVSLCSRFLAKPTSKHTDIAKRVLRNLKGSTDLGITYHLDNTENLFVHTDSNFQDRTPSGDGRSTSGYGVYLAGGLISWSSSDSTALQPHPLKPNILAKLMQSRRLLQLLSFY